MTDSQSNLSQQKPKHPLPFIAYHFILSRTTLSQIGTSKPPMRQLTRSGSSCRTSSISKLPMRQLTTISATVTYPSISKLPMRQLTIQQMIRDDRKHF